MDTRTREDEMTHRIQIDDVVRDATPEETARIDAERKAAEEAELARVAALEASAAAKVSAQAKLSALGLSDDEIRALLGA